MGRNQTQTPLSVRPEYGQANVHVAVMSELRKTHPEAEFHLASAPELAARCPKGVTFRIFNYESMMHKLVHGPEGVLKFPGESIFS